ncbi:MAG: amino acid permease [Acidobacteria bacterium]|nr:amino acid permease [Acidobacteriota bacterium]
MNSRSESSPLVRGMGLLEATSANMLEMIGIGPFITIPIILAAMGGPQAMLGWIIGAVIAICDGLVWAELGAAMPGSGGSYHYLQEAFGPRRLGRLMSFLFIWQTVCTAPFSLASGAVGFANYTKYLWPEMGGGEAKLLAAGVCLVVMAILYRDIRSIGRLAVIMWVVVLLTVGWVLFAGVTNFNLQLAFDFPPGAFDISPLFFVGLGVASLNAIYDYGGYNNVCFFGGEVQNPGRNIPRAVLWSIAAVAVMYLVMTVTIIGVVPWREAVTPGTLANRAIVADFIQRIYGAKAAAVMTVLILWTTFASVFAVMLGYSRVPFAAASDGRFFAPFARLHPEKKFPTFALIFTGVTAALCCWFELPTLITALIVIQIIARDMAQAAAVILIRRNRPDIHLPFRMWLYPVPALIGFVGWVYILGTNGWRVLILGAGLMIVGVLAWFVQSWRRGEWPFSDGGRS